MNVWHGYCLHLVFAGLCRWLPCVRHSVSQELQAIQGCPVRHLPDNPGAEVQEASGAHPEVQQGAKNKEGFRLYTQEPRPRDDSLHPPLLDLRVTKAAARLWHTVRDTGAPLLRLR